MPLSGNKTHLSRKKSALHIKNYTLAECSSLFRFREGNKGFREGIYKTLRGSQDRRNNWTKALSGLWTYLSYGLTSGKFPDSAALEILPIFAVN